MALRTVWGCLLSTFALMTVPLPAAAVCPAPCSAWLCGGDATSVLVGTPIATGTIRVDEIWGAPTTTVRVGDQLGPSSQIQLGEGERAYLVFDANGGPWLGFNVFVVDAEGDVACPEGPLPLAEAVTISTSSDCRAAATRAGFGDKPCNDVIESTSVCAAGGSAGDSLAFLAGIGLVVLASLRRRLPQRR